MSSLGTLALLRHGESVGNALEIFSGALDVDLTQAGEAACAAAAARLADAGWLPDILITSELARGWRSAGIIAEALPLPVAVERDWRLNERSYGALTGYLKSEIAERFGTEPYLYWRRSLHGRPPELPEHTLRLWARLSPFNRLPAEALTPTESLADVIARIQPWVEGPLNQLVEEGGDVLVVAHGNSLRALMGILDDLSGEELRDLNVPNARPLLYRFERLRGGIQPIERGGRYLDPEIARAEAAIIAAQGGT